MPANSTLSFRVSRFFTLTLTALYLTGAVAVVLLVVSNMRAEALRNAEKLANLLLEKNLATHSYFNHTLKPALFEFTEQHHGEDYFDPAWMSSAYAVREMEGIFSSLSQEKYYYKECAIDARSPENEADPFERDFIEKLNADSELTRLTAIRTIGGEPYFTVLRRGEVIEENCLRCHTSPEQAPAGMVSLYGEGGSFDRRVGEVISAVSIRIPLADAYRQVNAFTLKLGGFFLVVLAVLFAAHFLISRQLLFRPLARLRRSALQISTDPRHLGDAIPLPVGRELGEVTEAFNAMSASLRRQTDHLEEQVAERTRELQSANAELTEDIAERRKTEEALERLMHRQQVLLDTSLEGIFSLDGEGRVVFSNPAAQRMIGAAEGDVRGRHLHEAVFPDGAQGEEAIRKCPVCQTLRQGEIRQGVETTFWRRDGSDFPVELSAAPIREKGKISGAVVTFRNIAVRKEAEQKIEHLAYFDALTGLPNRTLFRDRLGRALAQARREAQLLCLMFVDLDDFKAINDTFGHAVGDRFLQAVAGRLLECLRETDTVARMGGDEFVCFGTVGHLGEGARIAQKILDSMSRPVLVDGRELVATCSIGVVTYPEDGEDERTLLQHADAAMYRAKQQGKNAFHCHGNGGAPQA